MRKRIAELALTLKRNCIIALKHSGNDDKSFAKYYLIAHALENRLAYPTKAI